MVADVDCACLQREYCPPIDSALFFAIISDYDLSNSESIKDIQATLDVLKNSIAGDDTEFDPSGSSGLQYDSHSTQESPDRAQSWHGDFISTSDETDLTETSQSINNFNLTCGIEDDAQTEESSTKAQNDLELEALSGEDKITVLKEMFPTMKEFDIKYTLKKLGYNYGQAVEELLNQVFFEDEGVNGEEQIIKRGIDGFSEAINSTRGRKARGKRKKQTRRTSSTPAPSDIESNDSSIKASRWDRAREDVEFITQRTYLPRQTVTSTYHKSGASLPTTIIALCNLPDSNPNPYISTTPPALLEAHVCELAVDFPALPHNHLKSLINLTHPSTSSAHELARALHSSLSSTTPTTITPQYLPRSPSPPSPSQPAHKPYRPLPLSTATALAQASTNTRSIAYAQASAAHRKSKSNPLMSGAASYYSSIARDASASVKRYETAAADALVAAQSTSTEVDLHGVGVKDAVRIAKDRVEVWWNRGGGEWARAGKVREGRGLVIVTGAGRHSEGGKGKLGPAVGRMLVREGWRVEVGEGVVEVVGRSRR